MKITTKSNGYAAEALQEMIAVFNRAAEKTFGDCTVRHFYFGDSVDMADIILPNKNYGQFNICKNRVSFNGHSATIENLIKFRALTFNDELFDGKLLEIANA